MTLLQERKEFFQLGLGTGAPFELDCHLFAEPVALMLVGYGRISHWSALARFRLIAWGRRPMVRALAMIFTSGTRGRICPWR